ncbi:MAG: hypothetical protein FWG90_03615 [Oscillospiraceae bacterium]|nr:hypothetical protein [Oscillospiraceae bacterium]
MPTIRTKTYSGAVLEYEQFTISDTIVNMKTVKPKTRRDLTPEEKAEHTRRQSKTRFTRAVNRNFTHKSYYLTLTYNAESLPLTIEEAVKSRNLYIRRIKHSNPDAKIIAVTGYGRRSGRLHHHLIIDNAAEADIIGKWTGGEVYHIENLRRHNYYGMVDHGEDFTGLAEYLFSHVPENYVGKRWYQSKNLIKPEEKDKRQSKIVYTESNPPKAPAGYKHVSTYKCPYYKSTYIRFKFVRITPPKDEPPLKIKHPYSRM